MSVVSGQLLLWGQRAIKYNTHGGEYAESQIFHELAKRKALKTL